MNGFRSPSGQCERLLQIIFDGLRLYITIKTEVCYKFTAPIHVGIILAQNIVHVLKKNTCYRNKSELHKTPWRSNQ